MTKSLSDQETSTIQTVLGNGQEQTTGEGSPAWTGPSDWIERFMAYSEGIPSPEKFRLWSAITAVAGALEKRVWAETGRSILFPNLFTLLVSAPGIGKSQAIKIIHEMWYDTEKFKVAPDNMTKASLIDGLAKASQVFYPGDGSMIDYHTLLVAADEFGVFIPAHDLEFLSVLNKIFDNPKVYRETRRTLDKDIHIVQPQITILAGSQPGFLGSMLPEEAWTMGFTSRLIMVHSATGPEIDIFQSQNPRANMRKDLVSGLASIASVYGKADFTPEAIEVFTKWYKSGMPPVPDHSKLQHYIPRRALHTLKLSMISAASRGMTTEVIASDMERAIDWLLGAEETMPDVFREMVGKSDNQIMLDLHQFVWEIFRKKKEPVHENMIYKFLRSKAPADKIYKILEVTQRSGLMAYVDNIKSFIPRPKQEHGVE